MSEFKWKYDGRNFVCYNSDGQLEHCFSPEQMHGYQTLIAKLPSNEEAAELVQDYKDSLPKKPKEESPTEGA